MVKLLLFLLAAVPMVYGRCHEEIICFDDNLNEKINKQIGVELTGHYTYLNLAQVFEHHKSYYPKVAKYLRAKSAEELTHAERFIEYQNQRGGTVKMDPVTIYNPEEGSCKNVDSPPKALKCAMELEAHVTRQLTQLHHEAMNIKKADANDCGLEIIQANDSLRTHPADDLRLTQPMLVDCMLLANSEEVTTATYSTCVCSTINKVAFVELAEMIAHEFLDHQVEDTKEIASYYRSIMRLQTNPGLGDYLFDQHLEL